MNNDTQLIADLVKCVDMLLPGIGYIVADVSLLNDTLIAARLRELQPPEAELTTLPAQVALDMLDNPGEPNEKLKEILAIPSPCDGKEQDAFEEWAIAEKMNMDCHPLHWLFLDEKTAAARSGWRGALEYVGKEVAAQPRVAEHPLQTTLRDSGKLFAARATVAQQAELIAYKDQVIEQRDGEISRLVEEVDQLQVAVLEAKQNHFKALFQTRAELKGQLQDLPTWLPRYDIEAGDGPGIYAIAAGQGEWCRAVEVQQALEGKTLVTSSALRAVLEALIGPSHHIRELLATREPPELFPENPINKLIAEFNNPGSR